MRITQNKHRRKRAERAGPQARHSASPQGGLLSLDPLSLSHSVIPLPFSIPETVSTQLYF